MGEIFELLFTDTSFVNNVRSEVNKKSWKFTCAEIITAIEKFEENTLWDKLLGDKCVQTLRKNFLELRAYRNDIMHAHNIGLSEFHKSKSMFKKVNEELDTAIGNLIGAKEENIDFTYSDFNSMLRNALAMIQNQDYINDLASKTIKDIVPIKSVVEPELVKSLLPFEKTYEEIIKSLLPIKKTYEEIAKSLLPFEKACQELAKALSHIEKDDVIKALKLEMDYPQLGIGTDTSKLLSQAQEQVKNLGIDENVIPKPENNHIKKGSDDCNDKEGYSNGENENGKP